VPDSNVTQLRTRDDILNERVAQLQHALNSRVAIEQAKGILSERYGISVDDAFTILRAAARRTRVNAHELAGEVVSGPATPASITAELRRRTIRRG
jgi:AmiR/NasT family two-component response regulator